MKRLLPLLLVLLWGQNILWAQKGVLLRTQSESYAIDNQTDSLLPERKDSLEYYTFLRFNRRKDTLFVYKKDTLKDIAQKDAFSYFITTKKIATDKLQLLIGDKNRTDIFLFHFENPNIIRVNRDSYILSDEYSHFLKKKIFKKNLKMNGGTIINEADTAVYSTLYATYDDKGLQMLGKVNTNEPQLPFSFAKERKYIDTNKLIFKIEEQTPKNEATYTQELYFSGEKLITKGKNTQYGLNITTFYTETIEKIKNERCRK